MKGPKTGHGGWLRWAVEGKQTMDILRLGTQWPESQYLDFKDWNWVRA